MGLGSTGAEGAAAAPPTSPGSIICIAGSQPATSLCSWGFCHNKPPNKPGYPQQATERKAPRQTVREASRSRSIGGAVRAPTLKRHAETAHQVGRLEHPRPHSGSTVSSRGAPSVPGGLWDVLQGRCAGLGVCGGDNCPSTKRDALPPARPRYGADVGTGWIG